MYCTTCGKEIAEGEVCSCKRNTSAPPVPPVRPQFAQPQNGQVPPVPPARPQFVQPQNGQVPPVPPARPQFAQPQNGQVPPVPPARPQFAQPQNTQIPPMQSTPTFNTQSQQFNYQEPEKEPQFGKSTAQNMGNIFNQENMMKGKEIAQGAAQNAYGFWEVLKNLLGLSEADANENGDCYERNRQIAGDIIDYCEGETHVRQYHVANFRSRLQWLWAEGKVQVTNKRVIFRASGRSIIGKTNMQQEYIIDEIAGIGVAKGVRFSFFDFLLVLILLFPVCFTIFGGMTTGVFLQNKTLGYIFACILGGGGLVPFFTIPKKLFLKSLTCAASAGAFLAAARLGNGLFTLLGGVAFILAIISLFLFALKPSVSISIMSKAGTGSPISIYSVQHFRLEFAKEILPAVETDLAIKELGAIISDIQKLGDFGISKWKGKA
ncbi:MAG: hypothetical protein PHT89_04310 [Lachnospiraceae bacterium]|nr:hypothetical protein [Lachnospiraceae bacterium]